MELALQQAGGTVQVADAVFGARFNEALVHQVVTSYLAGARAGTRAQKTRAEVSGGNAKPWRQKGTGRARVGSSRNPIWRGGGVTFAARPVDHSQKVNKKMYRGAVASILSELLRQDRLKVVESLDVDAPKTQGLIAKLAGLQVEGRTVIVTENVSENLYLASRNNKRIVEVVDVSGISPAALVGADAVLMTVDSVKKFEEWLA